MHSLSSANLKGSIVLANFKSRVGLIVRIRSTYCRAASCRPAAVSAAARSKSEIRCLGLSCSASSVHRIASCGRPARM